MNLISIVFLSNSRVFSGRRAPLGRLAAAAGVAGLLGGAACLPLAANESGGSSAADVGLRAFVPIDAEAVRIVTRSTETARGRGGAGAEHRRRAWAFYDRGEWSRANDAFLSAIEQDSGDLEAAEGLAMSVYRSGDYRAAYRLGKELSAVMPSLARLVSGALEADLLGFLDTGDFAAARERLRHFPATEELYARLHRKVSDIDALASGLERSAGNDGG